MTTVPILSRWSRRASVSTSRTRTPPCTALRLRCGGGERHCHRACSALTCLARTGFRHRSVHQRGSGGAVWGDRDDGGHPCHPGTARRGGRDGGPHTPQDDSGRARSMLSAQCSVLSGTPSPNPVADRDAERWQEHLQNRTGMLASAESSFQRPVMVPPPLSCTLCPCVVCGR